jgi:hypothetical protein
MNILQLLLEVGLNTALLLGALWFLLPLWISERFKAGLQRENAAFLERLRWDLKAREQAARVAEFLALIWRLESDEDCRKATRLSWELALWLPADLYKEVKAAHSNTNENQNMLTALISVRKYLLKENAGDLDMNDILYFKLGIGKPAVKI